MAPGDRHADHPVGHLAGAVPPLAGLPPVAVQRPVARAAAPGDAPPPGPSPPALILVPLSHRRRQLIPSAHDSIFPSPSDHNRSSWRRAGPRPGNHLGAVAAAAPHVPHVPDARDVAAVACDRWAGRWPSSWSFPWR